MPPCGGARVLLIGFDQAAFDAMMGPNTFPLAKYYTFDVSPNVALTTLPGVPLPPALPLRPPQRLFHLVFESHSGRCYGAAARYCVHRC